MDTYNLYRHNFFTLSYWQDKFDISMGYIIDDIMEQ